MKVKRGDIVFVDSEELETFQYIGEVLETDIVDNLGYPVMINFKNTPIDECTWFYRHEELRQADSRERFLYEIYGSTALVDGEEVSGDC